MSNDKFKNAPIHDKKAIIEMMDELEPKDMIEVVELLQSKQRKHLCQEMPVEWLEKQTRKPEWHSLKRGDIINKAKEMQKQRMIEFAKQFIDVVNIEDKDIENIYNETYGGNK